MHTQKNKGSKRISEELIYEVCSYIRVGAPKEIAASAAGISEMDYLLWMREGKSPHHYEGCKDCDFALFSREITKAVAQTVVKFYAFITDAAANGEWKASVWWLEQFSSVEEEESSMRNDFVTIDELNSLVDEVNRMRINNN